MASSRIIYSSGNKIAVILAFILSITLFLLPTGRGESSRWLKQGKMVLGSKPPGCVNKCLSCRPCMAALVVIPSHHQQWQNYRATYHGDDDEDDPSYYLLSWKCKCGDNIYEP